MPRAVHVRNGEMHDLGTLEVPGLAARRVRVYLPFGYRTRPVRPALYVFDGQNVFDDHGSFAGGWHLHRAVDRLLAARRKRVPAIVAIDHGGPARLDELTPWKDGERLLSWMTASLIPRIAHDFSTETGAYAAAVAGSSMGGLAALYAHHRHPEAFGGAFSLSPSLFLERRRVFDEVAKLGRPWVSRIYLDCGAKEAGGRLQGLVDSMGSLLRGRGYDDRHLQVRFDARGRHDERSWQRRMPSALRFMYRA